MEKALAKEDSCDSMQRLRFARPNLLKCSIFVVGSREVLGDVEACGGGVRQNMCTCITEHASLFVISLADFKAKIMEDTNNNHSGINEYIFSKSMHLNRRIQDFRRMTTLMERKRTAVAMPKDCFAFACSNDVSQQHFDTKTLLKVSNREYDGELDSFQKRSPGRKQSIRSQKLLIEGSTQAEERQKKFPRRRHSHIPFAVRMISDIVQQEKRYNDLRGTHHKNAFELSPQLPTYFMVKMNLGGKGNPKAKCKT